MAFGDRYRATGRQRSSFHPLRAFTLVELLVVGMVVMLLAGILAPALQNAKRAVKSAKCQSNLHQISLALRMYVNDNGYYPLYSSSPSSGEEYWPGQIAPFLTESITGQNVRARQASCFRCPSIPISSTLELAEQISYGYSDHGYAFQGVGAKMILGAAYWQTVSVPESEIDCPSDTIAMGDAIARLQSGLLQSTCLSLRRWQMSAPVNIPKEQMRKGDEFVRKLHRGRANIGFCDGHVESNTLRVLFEETSDQALRRWNRDHEPHRDWLVD